MTLTPFASAFCSIAAPLAASIASTNRTVAPALMSASACVVIVVVLPCALSILNWSAVRPAASNAFLSNGALYCTYRVDVVVSGSRTPTRPVPEAARPLS